MALVFVLFGEHLCNGQNSAEDANPLGDKVATAS